MRLSDDDSFGAPRAGRVAQLLRTECQQKGVENWRDPTGPQCQGNEASSLQAFAARMLFGARPGARLHPAGSHARIHIAADFARTVSTRRPFNNMYTLFPSRTNRVPSTIDALHSEFIRQ